MDEAAVGAISTPESFCCPGESRSIDRATHLARLAAFYPTCATCLARHDTRGLSSLQQQSLVEFSRKRWAGWQWGPEGLEGTARGLLDPDVVRRFAAAFGALAWTEAVVARPKVLVGSDGRNSTAELVSVVCRALQLSGCLAVEVGALTTPCLAHAIYREKSAGAIWLGNATGEPHALSVRAFRPDGCPASSPGMLDAIQSGCESVQIRRQRRGGGLQRLRFEGDYLAGLSNFFHGLRPLIIVMDTCCDALLRFWHELSAETACRIVQSNGGGKATPVRTPIDERLARIAGQVLLEGAHLGIWIDGAGEQCRVIDQCGEPVDGDRLMSLLKNFLKIHNLTGNDALKAVSAYAAPNRQRKFEQITSTDLVLGCEHDRYWFAGPPATADALMVLCLLLAKLSESDRPLSDVLDAVATA